jgi:hypothetical protein
MPIKNNLINVLNKIDSIKKKNNINRDITLIAVSKTYSADFVKLAIEAGQFHFGENRVQEGIEKIEAVSNNHVKWHLIGHLQTNKAGKAVRYYDFIHSIDSNKIAERVNHFAGEYKKIMPVFIQINTTDEETKSGCEPDEAGALAGYIINNCPHLKLVGLMTIGPLAGDESKIRESFKKLSLLKKSLSDKFGNDFFNYISMGMSGDYETAIEEGATHVRIGSAIFGNRD